jgi:phage baseplate assembly protein W|tara:strand:- start:529 stop:927 length:399 start_codon:yes stop_codon:yes gene_type:complete
MASSIINRQYSDLDLNFNIHPVKKDINIWTNEQAVIHSVRNLLVTNHYERPFQPDLGSNIRRLLFEPLDNITASNLDREIRQTIKNFEPRVKVLALDITPNEEQNAFGVYLQFDIINRTEPITIRFLLQRIR